jgi:hypothetical protein
MGVLCNTCHGSGRMNGLGVMEMHRAGMACNFCQGRGYRHDDRRIATVATIEVGKVIAYDWTIGAAHIYLEETVNRGDRLIAICQGMPVDFELRTMVVAGMDLPMALRGWEVTMLVPQPLQPGAWILRKED